MRIPFVPFPVTEAHFVSVDEFITCAIMDQVQAVNVSVTVHILYTHGSGVVSMPAFVQVANVPTVPFDRL